jgi:hypothetical protein
MNCNRIHREGNCDGAQWIECEYCGAINNEPCRNIKKPELPRIDSIEYAKNALEAIKNNQSPNPYELVALVSDLVRRIEVLESTPNVELTGRGPES